MARAQQQTDTLLMPKATAVWLIENTALTFVQIADFTDLTEIEVESLANEEIGRGLVGRDPIDHKELSQEELDRCQKDPAARLQILKNDLPPVKVRSKGPKYTPVSKRGDKPDAIAYIIKHASDISDAQICKLIGTTKPTIKAIRERTHANISAIKPRHPADLGLCSYQEFETVHHKAMKAAGKDPDAIKKQQQEEAAEKRAAEAEESSDSGDDSSSFDFSNFLNDTMGDSQ